MLKLIITFTIFLGFNISIHAWDNPWTKDIDEGAIGSGRDNPWTKDIDEGAWKFGGSKGSLWD